AEAAGSSPVVPAILFNKFAWWFRFSFVAQSLHKSLDQSSHCLINRLAHIWQNRRRFQIVLLCNVLGVAKGFSHCLAARVHTYFGSVEPAQRIAVLPHDASFFCGWPSASWR